MGHQGADGSVLRRNTYPAARRTGGAPGSPADRRCLLPGSERRPVLHDAGRHERQSAGPGQPDLVSCLSRSLRRRHRTCSSPIAGPGSPASEARLCLSNASAQAASRGWPISGKPVVSAAAAPAAPFPRIRKRPLRPGQPESASRRTVRCARPTTRIGRQVGSDWRASLWAIASVSEMPPVLAHWSRSRSSASGRGSPRDCRQALAGPRWFG